MATSTFSAPEKISVSAYRITQSYMNENNTIQNFMDIKGTSLHLSPVSICGPFY